MCSNCFRDTDITIPRLLKTEISSFQSASTTVQAGLCWVWTENLIVGFLMRSLAYFCPPRRGKFFCAILIVTQTVLFVIRHSELVDWYSKSPELGKLSKRYVIWFKHKYIKKNSILKLLIFAFHDKKLLPSNFNVDLDCL